jgi:hypothetical protein
MTKYFGNHVVSVGHTLPKGNQWFSTVEMPTFIMGGVAGQAMSAEDVFVSVTRMFGIDSATTVYLNGKALRYNGDTSESWRIQITPAE